MPRRPSRLLMLLHGYFPEPRVAAEARAALDAGFEVEIVALRRPGDARTETIAGVNVRRLPMEHRRGATLFGTICEYVTFTIHAGFEAARLTRRRRYDVVQVHSPPDFLMLAALVPRLLGAKVVLDVHDLASDMFMMRFEPRSGARVADRALRLLERWAGRTSTAVLTVHEPYRRELAARGVPREKITVVMNSLDERLLPPRTRHADSSGFTIVYHGTLAPHYGVGLIVEAAGALQGRVSGLRVEIYGEGDALPGLRARTAELGLEDAIELGGHYVPQEEVLFAVQNASVGVVPNLPIRLNQYALSTKLLEYVALGVPVVSADLPTIREHFSDEEVRYFKAGDAASLAEALAEVAEDPAAAVRRADAARRRYEEYRWERSARAYVDALHRATNSG